MNYYPCLIFPSRVCERSYLIVLLICTSLTSFTLYLDFLLDELSIHILCLFSNWDVFLYQFVDMFNRESNGTPLQCSCLENPMDGGTWWAAVHGVTKSRTRLSDFTFTFHFSLSCIAEGNGNSVQCSCLENPGDGGAWWAAVYGVAQSRTRLKRLSSSILS